MANKKRSSGGGHPPSVDLGCGDLRELPDPSARSCPHANTDPSCVTLTYTNAGPNADGQPATLADCDTHACPFPDALHRD